MNRKLCIGVIVFGALLAPAGAMAQEWKELGPAPITNGIYTGRIAAVACSPTNPGRYFIGSADGGVWRTNDGGTTWQSLTPNLPTSAFGAIALDPSDENTIYAGSGEGNHANHSRYGLGLFKSVDGGDTWSQFAVNTFAGRCFTKIVVNSQNPQVLYASITRAGGFPEMAAAKLHPLANGPIGIFRSSDGGVNWSHLTNGLPNQAGTDLAIDPVNPSIVYAAIGYIFGSASNGIYKSIDGGDSWTKLAGGLPTATVGRISLAISPSNPQRLYTLITNPCSATGGNASSMGAYRTDNAGATWTQIGTGVSQATYGWYLSFVSVHPTTPDTAFFGGLNLSRTVNAGASYSNVTPPHVDMHGAAWDAQGRLLVADDGGLHRSANNGTNWQSLNVGLGVVQIYAGLSTHPTDPNIMFGGMQDNGSNRRNTDTLNWTSVTGGDGGWTQIDQLNPSRVFTESQGTGVLYRSTNGGASFSGAGGGISGRNCFLPPFIIDPNNSDRVLYGTERVFRSLNGGSNDWVAISPDITASTDAAIRALAIAPSDSNVVYAATNNGRVLISTDGGFNFTLILSGIPGWPRVTREIFVDPGDAMTMYLAVAAFGETQVRRTRDGGQSWEPLDLTLPDVPVNVVAADSRCGRPILYAGSDVGVYRSVDDGATWAPYATGLPTASVTDLRLEPWRDRLVVGTMGRGAWSVDIRRGIDFNDDGVLNLADFGAFQTAFALQQPRADFNNDGELNLADFGAFQTAFALGCP